uniref:Reverse transcriptase domain-containing protein n=1 Tax=Kryptolebias marmoratus TaxID=37003 RepID=A0A3Q2ZDE1_KRYMA
MDSQTEFLDSLELTPLDNDSLKSLQFELNAQMLSRATSSMKSVKSPGPDEIPIEIYNIFQAKLIPPMLDMYQEAFRNGSRPPSLNTAIISLLLKPGKPATQCGSYRTISLINNCGKARGPDSLSQHLMLSQIHPLASCSR